MSNTLLLNPYDPDDVRVSGQLATDASATVLAAGEDVIELDIPLLPVNTLNSTDVYLMGKDGPTTGPLKAGAGGQPKDDMDFFVPGLTPLETSTVRVVPGAPFVSTFELTEPLTLWGGRLRALADTANVTVQIKNSADVLVWETLTYINGAQVRLVDAEVRLRAGHYTVSVAADAGITLDTVIGYADWALSTHIHAFSFRMT